MRGTGHTNSEKVQGGPLPLLLRSFDFFSPHFACPGQFQAFSLHDPLHGKLFSTYLRPSPKPQASAPGGPAALANGTLPLPKQKGD